MNQMPFLFLSSSNNIFLNKDFDNESRRSAKNPPPENLHLRPRIVQTGNGQMLFVHQLLYESSPQTFKTMTATRMRQAQETLTCLNLK